MQFPRDVDILTRVRNKQRKEKHGTCSRLYSTTGRTRESKPENGQVWIQKSLGQKFEEICLGQSKIGLTNKKTTAIIRETQGKKMTIADQIFAELDRAIEDSFEVACESLPASFQGKRKARSLGSIANQIRKKDGKIKDPRAKSVKFETVNGQRKITKATKERLQTIEAYAKMAEANNALEFDTNEDRLYRAELNFCAMLVKVGILNEEDFEND